MAIGKIGVYHEPVDQYGCMRVRLHFWPNGQLGARNDYEAGTLYLREPDYRLLVTALSTDLFPYEVEERTTPSYEQMAGTERS